MSILSLNTQYSAILWAVGNCEINVQQDHFAHMILFQSKHEKVHWTAIGLVPDGKVHFF